MPVLYIFTCPHGKHCNFIADCKDCAKAELNRLRKIIKLAKNRTERLALIIEDEPDSLIKQEINAAHAELHQD
jgi:hypothetical protein